MYLFDFACRSELLLQSHNNKVMSWGVKTVTHVMWSRKHENTSYTEVIREEFTFCAENERKLKECRPAKPAHLKAPRFQDRPRANDVDFARAKTEVC